MSARITITPGARELIRRQAAEFIADPMRGRKPKRVRVVMPVLMPRIVPVVVREPMKPVRLTSVFTVCVTCDRPLRGAVQRAEGLCAVHLAGTQDDGRATCRCGRALRGGKRCATCDRERR